MTVDDTRKLTKVEIEAELGEKTKLLESLGMTHVEACEFVSDIMNLGIAAQEKISKKELHSAVMILELLKELYGNDIEPMVHLLKSVKTAYANGYADGMKVSSDTITEYLSKKGQK